MHPTMFSSPGLQGVSTTVTLSVSHHHAVIRLLRLSDASHTMRSQLNFYMRQYLELHRRKRATWVAAGHRNNSSLNDDRSDKDDNDGFGIMRRILGMETTSLNQSNSALRDLYRQKYGPNEARLREDGDHHNRNAQSPSNQAPVISGGGVVRPFGDWSAEMEDIEDWEEWSGAPAVPDLDDDEEVAELRESIIERRRARRGRRTRVRDEYLRPIVDATGVYNRLLIGEREAEERVFIEAITNQYESREALKFAGILIAVPLAIGLVVSRLVAQPLWQYAERINPDAFALSDEQKVAGADEMHQEEVRLRMEASLGQAPPLTDDAILRHLHEEAVQFAERMKDYNRQSLLNIVSDSTAAVSLFLLLLPDTSQRAILFRTIGRVFSGLSDTAKAFLIILVTDTLLGYHSEEGWTAALRLLGHHYGWQAPQSDLNLFVATVPVVLDSLFKYWIFVGLNKVDPAAAVTLRQMDRH